MADVFVSYASADREWARRFAAVLESRGWSVWWDRTIPPGRPFDQVIEEALDSARCVVVLWSTTSVKSDWVKTEAADAARRRILVPALIDNAKIPLEFRRIQAANLSDWDGDTDHPELETLFASISELLRPPVRADTDVAVPAGPPGSARAGDGPVVPSGLPAGRGPRRRGLDRRTVALLAGMAAVVVAAAGGSAALWWRPRIVLPDVVGLPADRARTVLGAFGVSVGKEERREAESNPAGTVIAQKPTAGERVHKGATVELVVAATPRLTVPDLRGQPLEKARAVLQAGGLASGRTTAKVTEEAKAGIVLSQSPDAGARVDKGTGVELVIAARETVVVPSVVGEPFSRAGDLLRQSGLALGKRDVKPTDTAKPGVVLSQTPEAGESTAKGGEVHVIVSAAPTVPVPDVTGVNVRDAQARLERAGLKRGSVDRVQTGERPPDTVMKQNPVAGEQVEKGRSVHLTIASVPTVPVPDLTGVNVQDAQARLERAGLKAGTVDRVQTGERLPDTVVKQSPVAGEQVEKGRSVHLTIASVPTVTVPDVTGLSIAAARARLESAGLAFGPINRVSSTERAPDTVLEQRPGAGEQVEKNQSVRLTIAMAPPRSPEPAPTPPSSSGSSTPRPPRRPEPSPSPPPSTATIRVPDVAKRPVRDAMAVLERAGLVGSVRDLETSREMPGTVLFQHPRAGTEIERGKSVDLAVALAASAPDNNGNHIERFVWRDVSPSEVKVKVTYTYVGDKGPGVTIYAFVLDGSDRAPADFVRSELPVAVGNSTVELTITRKAGAQRVTTNKLRVCMANRERRVGVLCRTYAFAKTWG